jgi:ATP-dependent Clp protease adaptor protein ClpS
MTKKSLDKKGDIGLIDKQKNKLEPPKKYKVIFHNDDYTPFVFVEQILVQLFHKSTADAKAIAKLIHESGRGIAGIFPKSIAETKAQKVNLTAKNYGVPLLAETEPE